MTDQLDPQTFGNPETCRFWQAAAEGGKFLIKYCLRCGQHHWYPRSHCPHCGAGETDWIEASGGGSIYSFTVLRRAGERIVAYVTLDEGPTMFTNIVDCAPDDVRIGQRVAARLRQAEDGTATVVFAPGSAVAVAQD